MKRTASIFFCLLLISAAARAQDGSFLHNYITNQISLVAGFVPDASNIIVGEPDFLTFVVSNRSEQPFEFWHVHNEIFTITATNSAGSPVKSHYFGMDGNGFDSHVIVATGTEYTARIFLNERCIFEEPGDYLVTCLCDFGRSFNQTNALNQPIVTVFKLTVRPSSPEGVTRIIQPWARVVASDGSLNEAAQALAEIDDPRTIAPLAALVAKDANNYVAVNALARFTNDAAADALAEVLKFGQDFTAEAAGTALRKTHQADRVARRLLPGLTNAAPNVRIQNAQAMGWTRSELGYAPLCALLQDQASAVRYVAAVALGRLSDARSFAVLTNCLSDTDFTLRLAAVKGLLALGRPLQADWVKPMILSGGENIGTYYEAIDLLRLNGGDQAAPGLASCLHFDDPSVRHPYNFRLILALEYSPNGPKYYYKWTCDQNRDGTEAELAENRRILSEIKAWLEEHKLK